MTIDPPFSGANTWQDGVGILIGQKVEYNNNLYEATMSGVMATPGPTHKSGIVSNGTAALKYKGTTLKGNIFTRNDKNITKINITNAGIQYTSTPTVTITPSITPTNTLTPTPTMTPTPTTIICELYNVT